MKPTQWRHRRKCSYSSSLSIETSTPTIVTTATRSIVNSAFWDQQLFSQLFMSTSSSRSSCLYRCCCCCWRATSNFVICDVHGGNHANDETIGLFTFIVVTIWLIYQGRRSSHVWWCHQWLHLLLVSRCYFAAGRSFTERCHLSLFEKKKRLEPPNKPATLLDDNSLSLVVLEMSSADQGMLAENADAMAMLWRDCWTNERERNDGGICIDGKAKFLVVVVVVAVVGFADTDYPDSRWVGRGEKEGGWRWRHVKVERKILTYWCTPDKSEGL